MTLTTLKRKEFMKRKDFISLPCCVYTDQMNDVIIHYIASEQIVLFCCDLHPNSQLKVLLIIIGSWVISVDMIQMP